MDDVEEIVKRAYDECSYINVFMCCVLDELCGGDCEESL